jgi:cell division septal protein FtsQ
LRPFWILIVLAICVLIAAAGFGIGWPGFHPQSIDVRGNRIVSRDEILRRAGIDASANIWLQNPRAIAARVETIPYVDTATVHRRPIADVTIVVTERAPYAIVRSGQGEMLVDRSLRVLAPAGVDADASLPVLAAPGGALAAAPGTSLQDPVLIELRTDLDALAAAHIEPVALRIDRYGGLVATLRGGVDVLLGDDDDLEKKLPLVDPILAQIVRKQRRVSAIDLRAPSTPVLVYR